ncbi:MAG: hypothetical protein RIQ56_37 [Candidatus Parcubacteria bacterium]
MGKTEFEMDKGKVVASGYAWRAILRVDGLIWDGPKWSEMTEIEQVEVYQALQELGDLGAALLEFLILLSLLDSLRRET